MSTVEIKNIGLYLSARHGNRSDYRIVMHIYETVAINNNGLPGIEATPVAKAERSVLDIDHEGWYVFDLDSPLIATVGPGNHYSIVLFLVPENIDNPPDFGINYIDWFHSKNKNIKESGLGNPLHSFSSDIRFGSEGDSRYYSYGYSDGVSIFSDGYGYATGGSLPLSYDYFDAIGFSGLEIGKSQFGTPGNYAFTLGWELGNFASTQNIQRSFKLYGSFNDIQFVTGSGPEETDLDYVQINLPPAQTTVESFDNRQDFVQSTRTGTEVVGRYLTLSQSGQRLYASDVSLFDRDGNFSSVANVDWLEANLFLSVNDLNDIDIINISGNNNPFQTLMASAPFYSGVYFSKNGGSTWSNKTLNLTISGNFRNIQAIAFDPDAQYIMAIDNSENAEASKVFTLDDLDNGTSWTEQGQISLGVIVNSLLALGSDVFWAGTNSGVYKTEDKGSTWAAVNTGIDSGTIVYDLQKQTTGSGILLIATSTGTYAFNPNMVSNPTSTWVKIHSAASFAVHMNSKHIYIGTDQRLLRSIDDNLTEIFTSSLTFEGSLSTDSNYYAFGLLKQKITSILSRNSLESEIYVSQEGGVFVSKNDGGNFTNLSNKLLEKKVSKIISNPINNRVIYAVTETTKFSRAGATIILDTSGSSFSNDQLNRRIDFLQDIIDGIENQAQSEGNVAYYQLITFGVSEEQARRILTLDDKDFPGVTNETGGYVANAEFVKNKLEAFRNIGIHFRTPLNKALDISSKGLENFSSSWRYNQREQKYEFQTIVSSFFNELDRFVILVTDGFNTVLSKTLEESIGENTAFSRMRGLFYIVGIGHNINYEKLIAIRDSHQFGRLYTQPYPENISNKESDSNFKDATSIILDREKFRTRNGVWSKIVHYSTARKLTNVWYSASTPPNTMVELEVRSSLDKTNWSDWSGPFAPNISSNLNLFGKHFEFRISMQSNSSRYSPEVTSVSYTVLEPSESFVYYNPQILPNSKQVNEITITTLDDTTLNRIPRDEVDTQYGILQSNSTDFDFYKPLVRDQRNVVSRKEFEDLISSDGYFFRTERGPWPSDADYSIFDISDGIADIGSSVNPSLYNAIPEKGLVVFYDRVPSGTKYAVRINFSDSVYRVGLKATNFTNSNQIYRMHDVGWMFLDDRDTFLKNRPALPFVGSQLGQGETFGFASPQFPPVSPTLSNVITLQYVSRENYTGGTISIVNGKRLDISLPSNNSSVIRYYDQNFGLSSLQSDFAGSTGYVSVFSQKSIGSPVISDTDTISFKQQIDISVSSLTSGESLPIIIGDNSQGGDGLPSSIIMNNLLFEEGDPISCEYETTFIAGVSNTTEPVSTNDSPASFNRPLTPNSHFGGNAGQALRVIAPTTVPSGTSFSFIVLVVDSNGFIDRNSTASITIALSDVSAASISSDSYTFTLNDTGQKIFSGVINSGTVNSFVINVTLNGNVYESNPIVPVYDKRIRWGDLNVSTLFSQGRQDIDFAINYAKNTSLLDFIGIADDIESLDQQEFDFIRYKSTASTSSSFVCLPGFRYRVENSHGERVILFSNAYDQDEVVSIFDNPVNLGQEQNQIRGLVNRLEGDAYGWDYISMPIHSSYAPNNERPIEFDRRSFNYENYRFILSYGLNPIENINFENFVNNESVVEIYSDHGNTEYNNPPNELNTYNNSNFYDNSISHYTRYALRIGKRFGFTANAGNYGTRPGYYSGESTKYVTNRPGGQNYNRGLTAVRLDSLSAGNLIGAIRDRQTYATTGARIFLDFYGQTIKNGSTVKINMGEVIFDLERTGSRDELALYPNTLKIRAIGDKSNISRILVYKIKVDGNIQELFLDSANTNILEFNKTDFGRDTGTLTLQDTDIQSQDVLNSEYVYYVKVIQQDGHFAWASPIYFNYGRTSGIRSLDAIWGSFVFGPTPIGTAQNVVGIPVVLNGSPGFTNFPQAHRETLINTTSSVPQLATRRTPYSGRFLYVGNVLPTITGIRMFVEGTRIVSYGSHHPRFVLQNSQIQSDINDNFNDVNPSGNNIIYDVLNNDQVVRNRNKNQRDFLFSTMWQYIAEDGSSLTSQFLLDGAGSNAFSSAEIIDLVKDPFIFSDTNSNNYKLFFATGINSYPESSIPQQENQNFPISGGSVDYDSVEEFAGFTNNAGLTTTRHSRGLTYRIAYTDDSGSTSRSFNSISRRVPNNFPETTTDSGKISYCSSPNLIEVNFDYKYHLYFLGWILGPTNNLIPGMFVRKFNNFDELINEGPIDICFLFQSSSIGLPSSYSSRATDFNALNFIPKSLRVNNDIHPIYAHPWRHLSVVQEENGSIYAFVNYLNRLGSSENLGNDSPGTAILYSFDGINFYEKNREDNVTTIPSLSGKTFVHPFRYFGGWYMTYREVLGANDVGSDIRVWPLRTVKFNWVSQFEDNTD